MADDARVQVTIVGRQVGVVEAASETRIALAALEAQSAELSAKMRTFGADALAAVRGGESISSLVPRFVELDATIAATRAQMAALKAEAAAPIPFLARSDYKPPTQAIHYATASPATLAAVTRELEQQTTVTRQLGAAAGEYDAISAAQLQTRLATLRSESVAMRRNYTDEEKANRERLKFAETVAPQSSIAARRALDKDLFDAETASYARLAERQRAATSEMIANLRAYGAERERAAAQSLDFVSKISPQTAIKFTGGGTSGELKAIAAEAEHAGRSMTSNSNVIRHMFGMMDSAARDARGQFFSSLGAMIRDTGALRTAWAAIGPGGFAAAAGIAAIGYALVELIRNANAAEKALAGVESAALVMGRNVAAAASNYREMMSHVGAVGGVPAARSISAAIAEIPDISEKARVGLADISEAWTNMQFGGDTTKFAAALSKMFDPGEMRIVVEKNRLLGTQALQSFDNALAAGDTPAAREIFAKAIHDRFAAAQAEYNKLNAQTTANIETTMMVGGEPSGITGVPGGPPTQAQAQRVAAEARVTLPTDEEARSAKIVADATTKKGIDAERAVTLRDISQLEKSIADGQAGDITQANAALDILKRRLALEDEQIARQNSRAADPAAMQHIRERVEQAGVDAAAKGATDIKTLRENELRAEITVLQREVDAAAKAGADRVGIEQLTVQQIAQLRAQLVEKKLTLANEEAGTSSAGARGDYEAFVRNEQLKLRMRDELGGGATPPDIITSYQVQIAKTSELPQAQQAPARAELQLQEFEKLKQAQADLFRDAERGATAQERVDAARIASFRASQRAEVASHGESKAQEATNEQQFTASVMAGEEQRTEAMLQNTNLTRDQKDQLYQHLAELYAKDAEQQQQAEERITAAIEAENAKRIALFTNMFDTVGSSLEKLGTAELTGNLRARGEALRSLGTSLVSSGIHAVGSLASDWAGKEIGPSLGLSQEQSKGGLGEVLGNVVAKQLGLLKETPKTDQQKAAELFQKAADAQDKAAGTFGKSVETFADASKRIADAMAKLTPSAAHGGASATGNVPLSGGSADAVGQIQHKIYAQQSGPTSAMGRYGPMSVPTSAPQIDAGSSSPDSAASSAVNFAMEAQGEKLKAYCATLVNDSLERAGVKGTGSGLASSFKNYGTAVPQDHVQKGDVFYAQPSGEGDTGHVGFAMGPVQGGQVQVMSSHMQGPASNPAGVEYRSAADLQFRRPDYASADQTQHGANDQLSTSVRSLDTTTRNATAVGQQGVTATTGSTAQGQQTATALGADKTANDALRGATTESKTAQDGLTSATKSQQTAVEQNTTALKQPPKAAATTATGSTSASATAGVPTNALTGANDNAGGSSNWALLTQGLGVASGALALFGSNLSTGAREVLGGVAVITQLTSFTKNLNQTFDLFGTATKTASTATTLSGAATTTNAADFALNSVAVQTNATAQTTAAATSAASGAAKGLFGLGILGLAEGGVVYAADGWPSRGTDTVPAMLTPGETVLSVAQTRAMASNANFASASVGGVHPNFQTLTPPPAAANHNAASTFNYSPQISGRFGSMSRGEVNNILRSHGDAFTGMARNFVRNNGGLYGR